MQTQQQVQVIHLNLTNSGDPELEARILREKYSAGRQLGRISAVVEVLLDGRTDSSVFERAESKSAIDGFRSMVSEIDAVKRRAQPEELVQQVEALKQNDPAAFARIEAQLRALLVQPPADGAAHTVDLKVSPAPLG